MKIGLSADHGGYILKDEIKKHLENKGYELVDYGVNSDESVDYPDYAKILCNNVIEGNVDLGMVFCGTGIGISIASNKVKGIRCGLIYDEFSAEMAKRHNNCNVIAMGGRTMDEDKAKKMVDIFLSSEYENGRHQRRLNKIHELEN